MINDVVGVYRIWVKGYGFHLFQETFAASIKEKAMKSKRNR